MLEVARYGYLTATAQCGEEPGKEYFIHAARLLPKAPFGELGILERVTTSNVLDHLQKPAKIGIDNKKDELDQMDGFVLVDLEKYMEFASRDPPCRHKEGAFGAKKTFCPVWCTAEEGVSFATWENHIFQEISYPHTLRSFHKVNMFLFKSIYSSDSCTAGRSIGIDQVRPVGLANRPQFHVGCEEIFTEHWIVPVAYYSLFVFVVITCIPYITMISKVTRTWVKTGIVANIDFASGICNKKSFYMPLFLMSTRQAAVIHALCIATAINGPSLGTIIFGISQTLPIWGITMVLSILLPKLRAYKGIKVGEYVVTLRISASIVIASFMLLYTIWLTAYNNDIRNLYLGGYPVVQSILKISGASRTVDHLRNIGMYQKWTSLGVYDMAGSPNSGIADLLLHWFLIILLCSIRVRDSKTMKAGMYAESIDQSINSDTEKEESVIRSEYERRIQIEGHTTGKGAYGDSFHDFRLYKKLRFSTLNCQINDGFFVYGKVLVNQIGVLGLMFGQYLCLNFLEGKVKAYGYVKGSTLIEVTPDELEKRREESIDVSSERLRVTNIG